ncbi:hypothetical protein [Nitrosospira sp. Is2]|uniref:hypothetical protein n=1 Tax=Nitrosospira sp. Is2 TaxID=3080532 RepID=UPI0029536F7A|nr:hypothetical protein [Nitrosospira sp. Is2]WON73502.1 hypothetical protein R5L00_13630 [Nitrosospira sp. Is2]
MKKKAVMLLLVSLVSGCATLRDQIGTKNAAAVECAAAGGGLGYGICDVAGGNSLICALIGVGVAVVGGGVCYGLAAKYEERNQELVGKENDLDARLEYVRKINEDTEKSNEELKSRVAEASDRTDKILKKMKEGKSSPAKRDEQKKKLLEEEEAANQLVVLEEKVVKDMRNFQTRNLTNTGEKTATQVELDKEIEKLELLLAETQRQTKVLASKRQSI